MDTLSIVIIALGLSMDAFAVSITSGFTLNRCRVRHAAVIALAFGGFQAVMPVIGWAGGMVLRGPLQALDHWIAFGLLVFIGGKMVWESRQLPEQSTCNPLHPRTLLLLAVATSIDALAVGVTFAFLNITLLGAVLIIGAVTFALSFAGVYIGSRFGHLFEKKMELAGGLVLVAIGVKILVEHLVKGV